MNKLQTLVAASAVILGAGAAQAVPVNLSYSFNTTQGLSKTETFGEAGSPQVTVTATSWFLGLPFQSLLDTSNSNGLGVCSVWSTDKSGAPKSCTENGNIDGLIHAEALVFDFTEAVTVTSISFALNDENDDYFLWSVNPIDAPTGGTLPKPPQRTLSLNLADMQTFLLGTASPVDQFRVTGMTVTYDETAAPVPLPAAGLLLAGGLGAMGLLRRRRKAA